MVDQLSAFASEVTRVALEVGTQGILDGQAQVEGVQSTWVDLTRKGQLDALPPLMHETVSLPFIFGRDSNIHHGTSPRMERNLDLQTSCRKTGHESHDSPPHANFSLHPPAPRRYSYYHISPNRRAPKAHTTPRSNHCRRGTTTT